MIYYLFTYNINLPGVNVKIRTKIKALQELGLPVKGIVLYSHKDSDLASLSDDIFDKHYYNPLKVKNRILRSRPFGLFYSYFIKRREAKFLYNEILEGKKIDLLITRYGTSDFSTLWLVKKLKGKVLYESNTNEIEQLKLKFTGLLKSSLWRSYDFFCEKYLGPKVLRKVKGVICVTNEIAAYQASRIGNAAETKVSIISNGIETNDYEATPFLDNGRKSNLMMICGNESPWHGLDLIIEQVEKCSLELTFFVVGDIEAKSNSSKIVYTGKLNTLEITNLIKEREITCGIGSLALERAGLFEACPLKVREYLARGLPVVYNYFDTDIDNHEMFRDKYCIKLENGVEKIDLNQIISKLKIIQSIDGYQNSIRTFAIENIDMKVKMLEYKKVIDFVIK